MSNSNKYKFYKEHFELENYNQAKMELRKKYFNLWMNKFKWSGLDEECEEQQKNYIMRKLYKTGKIAAFKIANTELMGFAEFTESEWNMFDYATRVQLINSRNVSNKIIPATPQEVNKDVVIGYCLPNKCSIEATINYYAERIAQVEAVINTNLQLHKLPILIAADKEDSKKLKDIVDRILNNEVVIYTETENIQAIQSLAVNTPYIIDKLVAYKNTLENEVLTFLGIDNSGGVSSSKQLLTDEVNSSNQVINQSSETIETSINEFLDRLNKVFNRTINIEKVLPDVGSEANANMIDNDNAAHSDHSKPVE